MSGRQDPKASAVLKRGALPLPKWRLSIRGRWAPTALRIKPHPAKKAARLYCIPPSGYHTDHECCNSGNSFSAASHRRHLGRGLRRPERRHGLCGPLHRLYLRAPLSAACSSFLHRAAQQARTPAPRRHQASNAKSKGQLWIGGVCCGVMLCRKLFSADRHHVHVRGQGGVHYGLYIIIVLLLGLFFKNGAACSSGSARRWATALASFSLHYGEPDHPVRRFPDSSAPSCFPSTF